MPDHPETARPDRLIPPLTFPLVALSLAVLTPFLWGTSQQFAPFYFALVTALGWLVLGGSRWQKLHTRLQHLPGPPVLRAILLGYLAVIAEESLVGSLAALNEGFTPALWLHRMTRFIAFNLLAFSGAIWGLTIAARFLPGLRRWHS